MAVTFLFGSGADTNANNKLKSGASFAESLLTNRCAKDIKIISDVLSQASLIYSNSKKVYIQTISEYSNEARESGISEEIIDYCENYYDSTTDKNNAEFDEMRQGWFKLLTKQRQPEQREEKIREFFYTHALFFDTLDEKFNSLKNRELNTNAKRVLNAYWTVFFLMLRSLDWKREKKSDFETILDFVEKPMPTTEKENYYTVVANSCLDKKVITTNYTDLVETTGCNDIVYLHGRLSWFEDATELIVYDSKIQSERDELCDAKRKEHKILPFILIPSGVKPIICAKQIEQFCNFIKQLRESNYLCVIGYRFNFEDNHINSIIAEWLRCDKNRKMLYFNYEESVKFNIFPFFKKIACDKCKDENDVNEKLLSDAQILNITVDRDNSVSMFAGVVNLLEKLQNEAS